MNLETEEKPKIASVGDYWDEKTMSEVAALLKEYEDLFPQSFIKLKGPEVLYLLG